MNESVLSKRLLAVLDAVNGDVLADIGADHGYIPIFAVKRGLARRAIACDLRPRPLEKAAQNARISGLSHMIETRMGYGLSALEPGEADCLVISGMGGILMAEILRNGADVAEAAQRLVLQPQRDIPLVRRYLYEAGLGITDEKIVSEDGQYYFIIICDKSATGGAPYSPTEYELSRHLLTRRDPVLISYIEKRLSVLHAISARIRAGVGRKPVDPERAAQIGRQIEIYTEALNAQA